MDNDDFDQITFDLTDYDNINFGELNPLLPGLPGYPIFDAVQSVQMELQEQQLRNQHADLKAAYEEYQNLLEKYKFWDTLNKE